jgi:hypothetical protein
LNQKVINRVYFSGFTLCLLYTSLGAIETWQSVSLFGVPGERVHTYGVIKSFTLLLLVISFILTQLIHRYLILFAVLTVGHSIFLDYMFSNCNLKITVEGNWHVLTMLILISWNRFFCRTNKFNKKLEVDANDAHSTERYESRRVMSKHER